jgi:hypothetical protein
MLSMVHRVALMSQRGAQAFRLMIMRAKIDLNGCATGLDTNTVSTDRIHILEKQALTAA